MLLTNYNCLLHMNAFSFSLSCVAPHCGLCCCSFEGAFCGVRNSESNIYFQFTWNVKYGSVKITICIHSKYIQVLQSVRELYLGMYELGK